MFDLKLYVDKWREVSYDYIFYPRLQCYSKNKTKDARYMYFIDHLPINIPPHLFPPIVYLHSIGLYPVALYHNKVRCGIRQIRLSRKGPRKRQKKQQQGDALK